jgi:hypothetical protein
MVRPSRRFGDLLLTYWAEAILLFPEEKEFPSPQERVCHLDPKTLLKIRLPHGVRLVLNMPVCRKRMHGWSHAFVSVSLLNRRASR